MRNKTIYLDNAASTPIDKKVVTEMVKAAKFYGNPSSYNDCGRQAREYLEKARLKVARFLGTHSDEITFITSGTEANNLAIQGIAKNLLRYCVTALQPKLKPHIVTTKIEHPSVLRPIERLEKEGFDVSYLSVDKEGFVNIDELQKTLRPETVLVSVMYANNEIGTIEPIAKISKVIRDFRDGNIEIPARSSGGSKYRNLRREKFPIFHVDACQATEYLDMNVNRLGVDLLTFNGSKIYGPKGIGVLYVRKGVNISSVLLGGEQEAGLRAGTENLMAIGGLVVALDRIESKEGERVGGLRDFFIEKIERLLPDVKINGPVDKRLAKSFIHRLPNNVNISVPGLTSEILLLELDKYGICAGSGSACTSHSVEPSHVLKAIGLDKKYLDGALRFSMGRHTTKKDIDYVLKVLPKIIKDLRKRYKV
ncbi:MAG: cysteine desulfurase [Candidatus Yanofskybacteria bacterium]|nr:cysteine desulfurase [Candidatus Yanofskybacteria bacterium]